MKIRSFHLVILIISLFWQSTNGICNKKGIDKEYWRELKKGIQFDESSENERYNKKWNEDVEENKRDGKGGYGKYSEKNNGGTSSSEYPTNNSQKIKERRLNENETRSKEIRLRSGGGSFGFLGYLFATLGVLLLVFILYHVFKNMSFKKDKKVKAVVYDEDVVEEEEGVELALSELEIRLNAALKENNFREAVRIYFIFIIKALKEKNWIVWEKKKTNTFYLHEMRNRNEYQLFSQSVMIFEFIWYGKKEINRETFNKMEPLFKKLLNEIEK